MAGIAVRHPVQEVAYAAEDCGGLLSYDNLTLIYMAEAVRHAHHVDSGRIETVHHYRLTVRSEPLDKHTGTAVYAHCKAVTLRSGEVEMQHDCLVYTHRVRREYQFAGRSDIVSSRLYVTDVEGVFTRHGTSPRL